MRYMQHLALIWNNAREKDGLDSGERGRAPITHASMLEYYSAL